LINFQKKSKNSEKTTKIQKICFFNIFASFLASSQKNLNFRRFLERVILKSPIFLIRVDVDKKNPKK